MCGVFPFAFFIWLIRPLYKIEFVIIPCEAIGHFAGNVDAFLIDQAVNIRKKTSYIFYYALHKKPINQQLHVMWTRVIPIITSHWLTSIIVTIELLSEKIPFLKVLFFEKRNEFEAGDKDKTGKILSMPPFLKFTSHELTKGAEALEKMGIPKGGKYIILHSRDRAYGGIPQSFRNTKIESFFQAAKYLSSKGYYIVRTGAKVATEIPDSENYIIDYATKWRSEFLDIYLSANCAFYFGDSCGFFALSTCFRKPIATTNLVPVLNGPYCYENAVLLPKKYWLASEKRYMSLSEIAALWSSGEHICRTAYYQHQGIELHDNTPEELLAFAMEVEARFDKTYPETEEEKNIQNIFRNTVSAVDILIQSDGVVRCKISSSFTKLNSFFLQEKNTAALVSV